MTPPRKSASSRPARGTDDAGDRPDSDLPKLTEPEALPALDGEDGEDLNPDDLAGDFTDPDHDLTFEDDDKDEEGDRG